MRKNKIFAAILAGTLAGTLAASLVGCGNHMQTIEKETDALQLSKMTETLLDNMREAGRNHIVTSVVVPTDEETESADNSDVSPTQTAEEKITEVPDAGQQKENQETPPPVQKQQETPKPEEPPQVEESQPAELPIQEPAPEPVEIEPPKPKSIYDYEFDIEAIQQELISLGEGMGLTHITMDDGRMVTPDTASWATPVTASESFQGANLERRLKDYVRSMPNIITAYGGNPITLFTIYIEPLGGGSYRIYFLY